MAGTEGRLSAAATSLGSAQAAPPAPLGGAPPRPPPVGQRRPRLRALDYLLLVLFGATLAYLAHRIQSELDYRWRWSVVSDYLVHADPATGDWRAGLLLQGLAATLRLTLWSGLLAAIIGVALGLCRVSGNLFLRMAARTYIDVIRGIPPLVIIFVFYFFISSQIVRHLEIEQLLREASPSVRSVVTVLMGPAELAPAFLSAMFCLALFEAAYVAEIVRAGIQSIGSGQWEAAASLALPRSKTMRLVILPQAFQRVVPPLAGQFITLLKDSSIASLISVQELAFMAAQVSATTSRVFEVWLAVSGVYFALCFGLALLFGRLERQMALQRH